MEKFILKPGNTFMVEGVLTEDDIIRQANAILDAKSRKNREVLNSPTQLKNFFRLRTHCVGGLEREVFSIILLDNRMRPIEIVDIPGSLRANCLTKGDLLKLCVTHNACSVILGYSRPSGAIDVEEITLRWARSLRDILSHINVTLIDFMFVGLDGAYSCAQHELI